jgi:hypothetical protein
MSLNDSHFDPVLGAWNCQRKLVSQEPRFQIRRLLLINARPSRSSLLLFRTENQATTLAGKISRRDAFLSGNSEP